MAPSQSECPACNTAIRKRLKAFDLDNQIVGGAQLVSRVLRQEIDKIYPGLFALIQEPWRWIGSFGVDWFPLNPERMAKETLHVEVVVAPLPFVAAVVRVLCPKCGHSHRIVHLGANFYVMTSHLSAYFAGTGLPAAELALFIRELMSKTPNWKRYPPPHAVPRDIVSSGMAWLLCHEVGHFASPDGQFRPSIDVPTYAASYLLEEINADHNSFRILMHRVHANWQMDRRAMSLLLSGVSLVLRAWNIIIPSRYGRRTSIFDYGSRIGAMTPSPTLRWNAVWSVFDTLASLGAASREDYEELEHALFPDYEAKVKTLWEKFYEHEIAF